MDAGSTHFKWQNWDSNPGLNNWRAQLSLQHHFALPETMGPVPLAPVVTSCLSEKRGSIGHKGRSLTVPRAPLFNSYRAPLLKWNRYAGPGDALLGVQDSSPALKRDLDGDRKIEAFIPSHLVISPLHTKWRNSDWGVYPILGQGKKGNK